MINAQNHGGKNSNYCCTYPQDDLSIPHSTTDTFIYLLRTADRETAGVGDCVFLCSFGCLSVKNIISEIV